MNRKLIPTLISAAAVLVFAASMFFSPSEQPSVQAAPQAVPTPLAYDSSNPTPKLVTFFDDTLIAADTRQCSNLMQYDVADLHVTLLEASGINTTTLRMAYTGNGENHVTGVAFASALVTNTNDIYSVPLFSRDSCIVVDVTNGNTVTLSVFLKAK